MAENTQAPVRSQGWVNDPSAFPTELPSGVERTDKYYAYKTVYEDGRVEWAYYKRDAGPKPQDGQPPQDPVVATDSTIAAGIKSEWDKTHTPTATSQATAARDTITVDGRVKKYNPATGNYDLDQGAAGTAAASTTPGKVGPELVKGPGGNTDTVTWEMQPDGSKGRILDKHTSTQSELQALGGPQNASAEAKAPLEGHPGIFTVQRKTKEGNNETSTTVFVDASGAEVPDPRGPQATTARNQEPVPGFPGVYIVKAGSKDAQGNTASDTYYVDEAGNRVPQPKKPDPPTMINGKPYRLTADGRYEPVPVGGTGTQAPDISATNAELGQVADSLRTKAAQLAERVRTTAGSDNPYTIEDYKRDLTTERELAQAKVTEIASIGQEQRGIQQGERTEGASRRSFATSASTNAINALSGMKTASPTAGRDLYESIKNLQGMQKTFAESIPGAFPDVSRTPAQKSIMSMGLDGKITIDPSALAGAGAPGGIQQPDLNSIGAQFGATGGVPRDPTGVFMPPGNASGLSLNGGQVTAPGFSEGQQAPPFQYDPFNDGQEPLGAGTGFEDAISSAWGNYGAA